MQLGQGFAGTKTGKIKIKIKKESLTTLPIRKSWICIYAYSPSCINLNPVFALLVATNRMYVTC